MAEASTVVIVGSGPIAVRLAMRLQAAGHSAKAIDRLGADQTAPRILTSSGSSWRTSGRKLRGTRPRRILIKEEVGCPPLDELR